jgi:hypothetical protein
MLGSAREPDCLRLKKNIDDAIKLAGWPPSQVPNFVYPIGDGPMGIKISFSKRNEAGAQVLKTALQRLGLKASLQSSGDAADLSGAEVVGLYIGINWQP